MLTKATWNHVTLYRPKGRGAEIFHAEIVGHRDGYLVKTSNGPRGGKQVGRTATPAPVGRADAEAAYRHQIQARLAEGFSLGKVVIGPPAGRASASRASDTTASRRRGIKSKTGTPTSGAAGTLRSRSGRGKVIDFGIRHAKIRFARHPHGGPWLLGLEVVSTKRGEYRDYIALQLRDFPVPGDDVRGSRLVIRLPPAKQAASALGHPVTNLYDTYDHTPTENNRIMVTPVAKGRYRVTWSGRAKSPALRFELDCIAAEVRKINYL